jgi:hypothetical protein
MALEPGRKGSLPESAKGGPYGQLTGRVPDTGKDGPIGLQSDG